MERPRLFSLQMAALCVDPAVDYSNEPWTLVEFRLQPIASGTRLTVVESGFDDLSAERREEALRMNDGDWDEQMGNIFARMSNARPGSATAGRARSRRFAAMPSSAGKRSPNTFMSSKKQAW